MRYFCGADEAAGTPLVDPKSELAIALQQT
jgi:hypothetical protein